MRLRPLLFGAPACVLWLLFFTVSPLPAVIALLIVLAWLDHRHRRVVPEVPPADDDDGVEAGSK
jgi:hypothetical protein